MSPKGFVLTAVIGIFFFCYYYVVFYEESRLGAEVFFLVSVLYGSRIVVRYCGAVPESFLE